MTEERDVDEIYEDVKRLIHMTVRKFIRRHGGDYEDLLSDAHLHFMEALQTYQPDRGMKVGSWTVYRVWKGFLSTLRKDVEKSKYRKRIDNANSLGDYAPVARVEPEFDLDEFKDKLSKDSRKIVNRTINPPVEVLFYVGHSTAPRDTRNGLKEYFNHYQGWSRQRILVGFEEIRQALEDCNAE